MPGDSLNLVPGLRQRAALLHHAVLRTCVVLVLAGIGVNSRVQAEPPLVPVVAPGPTATTPSFLPLDRLTYDQSRLGVGKLKTAAEKRGQASALFAKATLLAEGSGSDLQDAIGLYRQVIDLEPMFVDAHLKLANLLLQTGQLDPALAELQSAAEDHPNSIPVEVALGYTQRLRGQNEEALRYCKRALTADPTQTAAMRVMLEIAGDQDDLAGGVLHIGDILKNGTDVPAASWLSLARLYVEVARNERVPPNADTMLKTRLPILQQAAAIRPPDFTALTQLADAYQQLGHKLEALKTYRRAAGLQPDDVDVALNCGGLEIDLGDTAAAIQDYENAYTLDPSLPNLRERLCSLYIDQGIAYENAHHPDKAQACFQKVFASMNCPPEAYLKLVLYQFDHKELKQASQTLATAEAHYPNSARIRYYEAIQKRYVKDYRGALACLDQARALSTGSDDDALDPNYYMESALTYSLAGQNDRLEAVLHEGLTKYPNNPEMMNELAYFWAEHGQHLPEALAMSQRASSLDPNNGPILDTLGWVYFQMGQPKDALPYLQRAALLTNNDAVVLQHVGDTYLKLGQRREAIATWTRALEKDPSNGDLTTRIDAAQAQANNAHTRSAPNP